MSRGAARALGLVLGYAADRAWGDPSRHHPVAWFGTAAHRLEQRTWRDDRRAGTVYAAVLVGGVVLPAAVLERRCGPWGRTASTALATWVVLGGTGLDREAAAVQARLEADDLPGARAQVGRIVGRRTDVLDTAGVARAAVESVAENTSDAVVGSLVWGALLGVPGLLGHRAVNTLDAMVGHRTPRHGRFGWASARLDDLAGLPGARLTAALAGVDLIAELKAESRSILDLLDDLAREHGLYATRQVSLRVADLSTIRDIMDSLRSQPPAIVGGRTVETIVDLQQGTDLPPTDGLVLTLAGQGRIIVRPSGTEPKIKAYLQVVVQVGSSIDDARETAERQLDDLADDVGQWFSRE